MAKKQKVASEPKPSKQWTVAIYMVVDGPSGSQKLDRIAVSEVIGIIEAANLANHRHGKEPSGINVVIQVDLLEPKGLLQVTVSGDDGPNLVVPDAPVLSHGIANDEAKFAFGAEAVTTSSAALKDFLKRVTTECPAERYLLILWGHSSGPVGLFGDRAKPSEPITRLTLPTLSSVLSQADVKKAFTDAKAKARMELKSDALYDGRPPIDIVLFKDCFMSTLEAAFELRESAQCMIGSQAIVPQIGWPYTEMFQALAHSGEAGVIDVAKELRDKLDAFYKVGGNRAGRDEVPFSVFDLSQADEVGDRLNQLALQLSEARKRESEQNKHKKKTNGNGDAILDTRAMLARSTASDPALLDVSNMCQNILGLDPKGNVELFDATQKLKSAVEKAITPTKPSVFQGVSVFYFPSGPEAAAPPRSGGSFIAPAISQNINLYKGLALSKKTHWDQIALSGGKGSISRIRRYE